ncbi:MAG: phosphoribosylformylglycinamidine synthase subunit PurQ [Gemmatimonadota bacterium]
MTDVAIGVVRFPGSNCDRDVHDAVAATPGARPVWLWHKATELQDVRAVILPGGFSYGDYLRPGAIARFSPIMDAVVGFARSGGPVLGICNGFQVLAEAGLLPGALMRNTRLTFVCRPQRLRVEATDTPFTHHYAAGAIVRFPVAHGDGNFVAPTEALDRLEAEGQVAFRYVGADDQALPNPNGSARDIAGVVNGGRNVLGLMPHPDRAMDALVGSTDGRGIFTSLVEAAA